MLYEGGGEFPPPFLLSLRPGWFLVVILRSCMEASYQQSDTMHKIREILKIGIPIMLGQACVIILAFADNIMIGWHSVEELAASSFVNNVMNLFILAELGFASGMTPIVGSFHGTGNVKGVGTTVKNGLALNGIVGLVGVVALTVIYFFSTASGRNRNCSR